MFYENPKITHKKTKSKINIFHAKGGKQNKKFKINSHNNVEVL